jgi:hypothetical protein
MMPELQTPFSKDFLGHDEATKLDFEEFRGIGEPEIEVVVGAHGQEFQIINIVRTSLNRRIITGEFQQSHIRVFHAHPEAIRVRHRWAPGRIDINRKFPLGEMPVYPPAMLLRELADKFPIKYVFSFHEDKVRKRHPFYFFDTPQPIRDPIVDERVLRLRDDLINAIKQQKFGHPLGATYTGGSEDDLTFNAVDGYAFAPSNEYDGSYETHLVDLGARGMGTVQRAFVFEIPGHARREIKQMHVDLILDKFVIPFISETLVSHPQPVE